MGNKEKILELIRNYWIFEPESQKYIEKELFNPEIDDVYAKYLDHDYRARFPVPENILEEIDKGWEIFKSTFKVFVRDNDITYEDFRSNKKLVNKNYIKLRKFLLDYYNETYKDDLVLNYDLQSIRLSLNRESKDSLIEQFVDDELRYIGSKKLPKKGISIVLSCNFEDWFFCSTGENWGSCLNLESPYPYWIGLPGLLGDKNRAMLYITDNKKKEVFNIEVDRILSRTWTLLDNEGGINLVKFYPNEYFSPRTLKEATGIEKIRENTNWDNFLSKNKVDFLFHEGGLSAFPFQDTTSFRENGTIEGYEKGHSFFDKNLNQVVEGEEIFKNNDGGLFKLMDLGRTIDSIRFKTFYCSHCGARENNEEEVRFVEDKIYCESCFLDLFFVCDLCEEIHTKENMKKINGDLVCPDCVEKHFDICDFCGEYVSNDDKYFVKNGKNENILCNICIEEQEVEECEDCGIYYYKNKNEIEYDLYENPSCLNCIKSEVDKKQIKFEFVEVV